MGQFMGETFSSPSDLLLGRKTYEIFAAHWPYVEAGDPIADSFNTVTKYVAHGATHLDEFRRLARRRLRLR